MGKLELARHTPLLGTIHHHHIHQYQKVTKRIFITYCQAKNEEYCPDHWK